MRIIWFFNNCQELNPLHPRMFCAKFGWIWSSWFLNFVNIYLLFRYYLPLEKIIPFILIHLNSLPQGCSVPSMVEIGWVVLEKKIFKFVSVFRYHLPLEIGWGPSFQQSWIPFTQGCFVPSLVQIGPVVLEKKIFIFPQCIFAIS